MANLTNSAKLINEMSKKADKTELPAVYDSTVTVVVNGNTWTNTFSTNQTTNSTLKVTVWKSDVGLWNVDNTSDANKPISTATQAALDLKADKSEISTVFKYKWSKANYDALPSSWNVTWDVWNVETAHTTAPIFPAWSNLAWDWSAWDALWGTVDLSWYQTTANLKTSLSDNSDTYYPSQKAVKTAVDAKANTSDVLTKTNTTSFTPTWDYQPATKKYVDDAVSWITWWDMSYSDYNFVAATWATVTMSLSTSITPSANFTVNAPSTIKDWQTYLLRVTNWASPYTMTLGTGITNPYSASTTLTANGIDQFVFLWVGWNLELQAEVDVSEASWATTTQPANPVAGSMYFDTTAWALKVYNWTAWIEVGWWWIQNDTTGTTSTVTKIRAWSEAEFNALSSKDATTIYHVF